MVNYPFPRNFIKGLYRMLWCVASCYPAVNTITGPLLQQAFEKMVPKYILSSLCHKYIYIYPIILWALTAHHTLAFWSWSGTSCIVFFVFQCQVLWVFWAFTEPLGWNKALSLMKRCVLSTIPLWRDCNIQQQKFRDATDLQESTSGPLTLCKYKI